MYRHLSGYLAANFMATLPPMLWPTSTTFWSPKLSCSANSMSAATAAAVYSSSFPNGLSPHVRWSRARTLYLPAILLMKGSHVNRVETRPVCQYEAKEMKSKSEVYWLGMIVSAKYALECNQRMDLFTHRE